MASELFLRRRLGGLFPADAMTEELLNALPSDKTVKANVTVPRNVKHHRKFFALLKAVFPHQGRYPTLEKLRKSLLVALGFADEWVTLDGRHVVEATSMSFASMDQQEFNELYDAAVKLILTKLLPGVDRPDLEREVLDILAGREAA